MKLNSLDHKSTTFVQLTHPGTGELLFDEDAKGKKSPVGITVYGQDTEQFRKANHAIANRRAKDKIREVTSERTDREGAELLASLIVSGQGIETDDGTEMDFTDREATVALLVNPKYKWIREQIDSAIVDRSRFFTTA